MKLWKLFGLASGLLLVTLLAKKRRQHPEYFADAEKRYDTDDFLTEQEL